MSTPITTDDIQRLFNQEVGSPFNINDYYRGGEIIPASVTDYPNVNATVPTEYHEAHNAIPEEGNISSDDFIPFKELGIEIGE